MSDTLDIEALTRCPAGGEHDIPPLEVIPAEGPAGDRDIWAACIKCGADGYPAFIAPVFCRCGAEITHSGYGWCLAGCPDDGTPPAPVATHDTSTGSEATPGG